MSTLQLVLLLSCCCFCCWVVAVVSHTFTADGHHRSNRLLPALPYCNVVICLWSLKIFPVSPRFSPAIFYREMQVRRPMNGRVLLTRVLTLLSVAETRIIYIYIIKEGICEVIPINTTTTTPAMQVFMSWSIMYGPSHTYSRVPVEPNVFMY